MVLINGVKYACDRCIRGHRVTTCTHTDQPLTMIKPKGRPASQCQHCREQRKAKSLHVTCTCGKKGKSPGMHLASCLCHKNSVCTCSSNASKKGDKSKKKLTKSLSELNMVNLNAHNKLNNGTTPSNTPPPEKKDQNFVIEDVIMPFETGNGLLDLFSPAVNKYGSNLNDESSSTSASPVDGANSNGNQSKKADEAGLDMSDNIFPLFPLVGTCSFDDSKSQPLSSLHVSKEVNSSKNNGINERDTSKAGFSSNNMQDITNGRSNISLQETAKVPSHFHPIRPKRPDSVVSMASTSSSKTNISRSFDNSKQINSAITTNSPSVNYQLGNVNSSNDNLKESNQETDLFGTSNVFMNHHQSQLNEYNQVLKNISGQKQMNNGQVENSKNIDSYGNIYQDSSAKSPQEQFYIQNTTDFEFSLFNDLVSPSSFDTKSDIQF